MTALTHASVALAESLFDDPFYWAITDSFGDDHAARKLALQQYFCYSLAEAQRAGRCVMAADPSLGAAAWLLPRTSEVAAAEAVAKAEFLAAVLGHRGRENYHRIVHFMAPLAAKVIPAGSWYLSIIGVLPSAQGRGIGVTLLAGTLEEASRSHAICYLETFTPRNLRFYERMGFRRVSGHLEPTTNREYTVMRRDP
jgi:GNAT superfamily N-acetyltransferase